MKCKKQENDCKTLTECRCFANSSYDCPYDMTINDTDTENKASRICETCAKGLSSLHWLDGVNKCDNCSYLICGRSDGCQEGNINIICNRCNKSHCLTCADEMATCICRSSRCEDCWPKDEGGDILQCNECELNVCDDCHFKCARCDGVLCNPDWYSACSTWVVSV